MRRKPSPLCSALIFSAFTAVILTGLARADEVIILRSGEQYRCRIEEISESTVRCSVDSRERSFPIDEIQRIDFERERQFDGLDSADALSAASDLFADALSPDTADLKAKYPQAGYVVLKDDTVIQVSDDGGFCVERTRAWRILEQRGADSAVQAVYYFPGRQKGDVLFGLTVSPSGEVARISDIAVKEEAVYPGQPEYNFQHRLRFTMKNPVPGSTLFLRTRLSGSATARVPLVVDRVFWGDEPAVEQSVTLQGSDEALERIAVAASGDIEQPEGENKWLVHDAPQVFWESLMPPLEDFAPRLVLAYPKAAWRELAAVFTDGVPAAIPAASTSEDARAVFDRVRRNVRLVPVPQDALPEPPAGPAEVLSRGYGTIVEKAILLAALLRHNGFDASAVLVRTRDQGALLADAPRLRGFDGAVVRLRATDGRTDWLEPAGTTRGFGELGGGVQGADGLDLASGEIVTIPARPGELEATKRTTSVMLCADGSAVVTDDYDLTGDDAVAVRFLADLSVDDARRWACAVVGSDLPGVDLVEFGHSDMAEANPVETLHFVYAVPGLAQPAGDFLILRMPNARYSPVDVGRSTRRRDLFWLGPEEEEITVTVQPPEGYRPYALSAGAEFSSDGWSLSADFSQGESRAVVYHETWTRTTLSAPEAEYQDYRKALITRGLVRNEMIVFSRSAEAAAAQ